jgi:hypothetical protein
MSDGLMLQMLSSFFGDILRITSGAVSLPLSLIHFALVLKFLIAGDMAYCFLDLTFRLFYFTLRVFPVHTPPRAIRDASEPKSVARMRLCVYVGQFHQKSNEVISTF